MFTARNTICSAFSMMAIVGMAACAVDATDIGTDENELGTTQQALSSQMINDGTHYSDNWYNDEEGVRHSRSSLETHHMSGSCTNKDDKEVYRFKANYSSQGLRAEGTFEAYCKSLEVKVLTKLNSKYDGSVRLNYGSASSMHWNTSAGVTWLLNHN